MLTFLAVPTAGPLESALVALVAEAVQSHVAELRRPELVSQRTVEAIVGLPRRDFLRLARDGAFPCTHERRLVLARTTDVLAYLDPRMRQPRVPANDAGGEVTALARVGARRVG